MDHTHTPGMEAMPEAHHGWTHMTFFWGRNSEILFAGWPGTRTGMYVLALIAVFLLCMIVEGLSHCRLIAAVKKGRRCSGLTKTIVHGLRVGLAYLVMLAVMSFNVGVLIAAILGHTLGYFVFGSGAVMKPSCGDSDAGNKGFGTC